MMKFNYYIKLTLVLCGITLMTSCSNDDDNRVFDETPQTRINNQTELLDSLLRTGQTFRTAYFPDDGTYGGSVIYFRFNTETNRVEMSSGFDENTDIVESAYEIKFATSVELVFSIFNHITKLSDNNLSGLEGTGFGGSSNFIFFGEVGDGGIELKDLRNQTHFVLTPISNEVFENSEMLSEEIYQNQQRLASTGSVFQQLAIVNGNDVERFDLNYDPLRLYATPQKRNASGAVIEELNFGIAFTNDGLTISPALEYEGDTFKNFVYNQENGDFVSTAEDGTQAIIGSASVPAIVSDDYLDYVNAPEATAVVGYRPLSWGDNPLTSAGFRALIDQINENLGSAGTFNTFQINFQFEDDGSNCQSLLFVGYGGSNNAIFCFSQTTVQDNFLFLEYNGPANQAGVDLESDLMPLIEFLTSSEGLYVTSEGNFSASNANFTNQSGTITSLENPALRVYVLRFQ